MTTTIAPVILSPEVAVVLGALRDGRITPEQASRGIEVLARHARRCPCPGDGCLFRL